MPQLGRRLTLFFRIAEAVNSSATPVLRPVAQSRSDRDL